MVQPFSSTTRTVIVINLPASCITGVPVYPGADAINDSPGANTIMLIRGVFVGVAVGVKVWVIVGVMVCVTVSV